MLDVAAFVISRQCTTQPVVAAGSVITPAVAVPPVPTLISNATLPFEDAIEGVVPKPEAIVGAVPLNVTTPARWKASASTVA